VGTPKYVPSARKFLLELGIVEVEIGRGSKLGKTGTLPFPKTSVPQTGR
jgi:hypothetical protein